MGRFLPDTIHGDSLFMADMMAGTSILNLTNHFLIAMPHMQGDTFAQSVVYICEHNEQGALGLILNKPTEIMLEQLFEKVEIPLPDGPLHETPVYYGGPVQPERGFVLHKAMHLHQGSFLQQPFQESLIAKADTMSSIASPYSATLRTSPELEMSSSKDVLEAIAQGRGPEQFLIALGYAGWGAGQLEYELAQNGWLTVQATPEIIFNTPAQDRYTESLALLGVQIESLVGIAGHA